MDEKDELPAEAAPVVHLEFWFFWGCIGLLAMVMFSFGVVIGHGIH